MRGSYTRREAIVAGLFSVAVGTVVWGPVILRAFGSAPAVDLRTLQREQDRPAVQARPSTPTAKVAKARPSGPVDINHADVATLQRLPGIGPTLAQRIVAHRETHGAFSDTDGLMEVDGIGPKRFDKLKAWIEAR